MLVSAIMPTRGRREWAQQALDCFMAQTYQQKEMVILDDYQDQSFPNGIPWDSRVFLTHDTTHERIPIKRNRCVELTQGGIIIHFDSDDYSVADRMEEQVDFLRSSGKSVAGYRHLFIYDTVSDQTYTYRSPRKEYVVGTSLIYKRDWWKDYPFNPRTPIASDNEFVMYARMKHQLAVQDGLGKIVARLHPDTSGKTVKDGMWDCLHGAGKNTPSLSLASKDVLPSGFFIMKYGEGQSAATGESPLPDNGRTDSRGDKGSNLAI